VGLGARRKPYPSTASSSYCGGSGSSQRQDTRRAHRVVVVETSGRPAVISGDMAVFFGELDEPRNEGQRLVCALDPELV
jgi:hypothetical protein